MRNIFLTTAALTLLPLVAMAQTATDTSTSTAGAVSEDVAGINQQFASSPAHTTVATVPEMGTQIVTPTATCTIPVTGQAVWLGMGVGGGTAYTVEYCKEAEQARIVYNMGDHASALMMMCSDAGFRKARALEGPIATCPPEYGPSGLTKAQTQQVDDQWIADNRAPAAPVDQREFHTNGTGYILDNGEVLPVKVSKLKEFCKTLSWHKKSDRPYLETECAGH